MILSGLDSTHNHQANRRLQISQNIYTIRRLKHLAASTEKAMLVSNLIRDIPNLTTVSYRNTRGVADNMLFHFV